MLLGLFLLSVMLVPMPATAPLPPRTHSLSINGYDWVDFGVVSSEAAHNVTTKQSTVHRHTHKLPCRTLEVEGSVTFSLSCPHDYDEGAPLHVTVQFSGDERNSSTSLVVVLDGVFGGTVSADSYPPPLAMCYNGGNHTCTEPVAPGRPVFSSLLLPQNISSRCSNTSSIISLTLRTFRGSAASPCLYQAALHTSTLFVPPSHAAYGTQPPLAPPRNTSSTDEQYAFIVHQIKQGISHIASSQAFGLVWDDRVQSGAPECLSGAIFRGGIPNPQPPWSEAQWKGRLMAGTDGSNNNWFRGLEVMAAMYVHRVEWNSTVDAEEYLSRVAEGLDFYRRAQGLNGGFVRNSDKGWVGGPARGNATGSLEGYGHMGLGAAFDLVGAEMIRFGLLDKAADDDCDPSTPNVTRWDAWADLFANSRDYQLANRGHAPNQDLANMLAAALANKALATLLNSTQHAQHRGVATHRVLPEEDIALLAQQALGLVNTTIYPDTRWFSPQGVSQEPNGDLNGGFTAGYGDIAWLAEWMASLLPNHSDIAEQAARIVRSLAKLRTLDNCFDIDSAHPYLCLRLDSFISSRHDTAPSLVSYGPGLGYGALVRRDPFAQRLAQLRLAHRSVYGLRVSTVEQSKGPHFPDELATAVKLAVDFPAIAMLPLSPARLPFEDGEGSFAWGDWSAGLVVVRHFVPEPNLQLLQKTPGNRTEERRIFASLQWRHGLGPGPRDIAHVVMNNATRVHLSTPRAERVAVIAQQQLSPEPDSGFRALNAFDYGPYEIAMNMNTQRTLQFTVSPQFVGQLGLDLVSGEEWGSLPSTIHLSPQQVLVLYAAGLDVDLL